MVFEPVNPGRGPTAIGTLLSSVVLLPNWPYALYPQHQTEWSSRRPQVCNSPPAEMEMNLDPVRPAVETDTGTLLSMVELLPN